MNCPRDAQDGGHGLPTPLIIPASRAYADNGALFRLVSCTIQASLH
jgi:hypothetical protein